MQIVEGGGIEGEEGSDFHFPSFMMIDRNHIIGFSKYNVWNLLFNMEFGNY